MNNQNSLLIVKNILKSSDGQISATELTKQWISLINEFEKNKDSALSLQHKEAD